MGMAASQARLLAITARMHDVELKAQRIEAEKIALATQEDAIYETYCEALDATKIQIGIIGDMGKTQYIDANYANTCKYNPDNVRQYSLTNNRTGRVIVPQHVKDTYEEFGNDKYAFAWAMLGLDASFSWNDPLDGCEVGIGIAQGSYDAQEYDGTFSLYMTEAEREVFDAHYASDQILKNKYDALVNSEGDSNTSLNERTSLLKEFREYLYSKYSDEIFDQMILDKQASYGDNEVLPEFEGKNWAEFKGEFEYYSNLWDRIKDSNGCETIEAEYQNGEEGTEWFNNMVSSGLVTIHMLDTNKTKGWVETSIATNIGNNYLQSVPDEKAIKKAEVEYEHQMKIINRKDTKFDTELKELETEETSLKTQIDSVKKVKDDNIDRTFGIFS